MTFDELLKGEIERTGIVAEEEKAKGDKLMWAYYHGMADAFMALRLTFADNTLADTEV